MPLPPALLRVPLTAPFSPSSALTVPGSGVCLWPWQLSEVLGVAVSRQGLGLFPRVLSSVSGRQVVSQHGPWSVALPERKPLVLGKLSSLLF